MSVSAGEKPTAMDENTLLDRQHVEAVATEYDIVADDLATTLTAHQDAIEDRPGVENIVYEWRKQYEDPLIARTKTAYYLVLPSHVWDEFGAALDLDEQELAAVVEVHRRTVAADTDAPDTPNETATYVALDRTL